MLRDEAWTDLGAEAHRWQQPRYGFTCVTANARIPTRRDYMSANCALEPLINTFHVQHDGRYPTQGSQILVRGRLARFLNSASRA